MNGGWLHLVWLHYGHSTGTRLGLVARTAQGRGRWVGVVVLVGVAWGEPMSICTGDTFCSLAWSVMVVTATGSYHCLRGVGVAR